MMGDASSTPQIPAAWPAWARWVAGWRLGAELGVGDTLDRLLVGVGGAIFKRTLLAMDIDCGCCDRRKRLNARFPYPKQRTGHGQ